MLLSLWANFHISHKLGGVTGDTYGAVLEGSENGPAPGDGCR